nr:MAG TPA: hypothetical protein [Caudoviricetes sp.]
MPYSPADKGNPNFFRTFYSMGVAKALQEMKEGKE